MKAHALDFRGFVVADVIGQYLDASQCFANGPCRRRHCVGQPIVIHPCTVVNRQGSVRQRLHEPPGCPDVICNRQSSIVQFLPGHRTLLDAHNAYPDRGRFADRIDVALATGLPVAIEQDLAWCVSAGGAMAPLVSHESTCVGGEPTLEAYFFERVRPIVEAALAEGPSADWPLITLNLDFKTNEPEHHAAVWALLGKYEALAHHGAAGRRCGRRWRRCRSGRCWCSPARPTSSR